MPMDEHKAANMGWSSDLPSYWSCDPDPVTQLCDTVFPFVKKKKKEKKRGAARWHSGKVYTFRFGSLGFPGSDPGCGHGTAWHAMLWWASHI